MADETQLDESQMADVNMTDMKVKEKAEPVQANAMESENEADLDAQLEVMKKQLQEVETARRKLANGDAEAKPTKTDATPPAPASTPTNGATVVVPASAMADVDAAIAESDARSVYVGNVDYGATVEELNAHFADCGTINRVTIMCNKATGMPKGFAYIEFAEEDAVKHATILDGTTFRQRKIKVVAKRTNVPGMGRGRGRRFRGRGFRGRGRRGFRGRWAPY